MLFLPIFLGFFVSTIAGDLKTVYEWKYIDYLWENEAAKQLATSNGQYNYRDIFPHDVQAYKDGRVWITTPRARGMTPASLSTVSSVSGDGGPLLQPYPSWAWHAEKNCSGIINTGKVVIDDCARMWLVDTGKIGNEQICSAKILSFDLKTDKLLTRFELSDEVGKGGLLVQLVETEGANCERTWVYAADYLGIGIIIYDGSTAWRLENEIFTPDPARSNLTVANETITILRGPSIITLIPPKLIIGGLIIIRSLNSEAGYAASLDNLRNSKYSPDDVTWYKLYLPDPSQELCSIVSRDGVVISGFVFDMELYCLWFGNPAEAQYAAEIFRDSERLQFMSSIKVADDEHGIEFLWVLSNRYHKWQLGTMDFREPNFRIMNADLAALINGTVCMPTIGHVTPTTVEGKGFRSMINMPITTVRLNNRS